MKKTMQRWLLGEYRMHVKPRLPDTVARVVRETVPVYVLTEHDKKVLRTLAGRQSVIFSGFRKSGNTWMNFILAHYFSPAQTHELKTLTFEELKSQLHSLVNTLDKPQFTPGVPAIIHTHAMYRKLFDYFDHRLYIYRNPLDTLVSLYHFLKVRTVPFEEAPEQLRSRLFDIDFFVLSYLPRWIRHYSNTAGRCETVVSYEAMRADAFGEVSRVISAWGLSVDDAKLRQSLEVSSFESVRKMGRESKQTYGVGAPDRFRGEFTRSGKTQQYLIALRPETIERARVMLSKHGLGQML